MENTTQTARKGRRRTHEHSDSARSGHPPRLYHAGGKAEKIKWKSSKRTIAAVSKNGKLTVKKAGKVTITASYKGKRYKYNLVIKKVQLKLKKKSITIKKGKAVQIKSVASPKRKIQYKSLDTKIASVTKKGKVVGKKKGKTKIRVSCNGLVRYCKVTVK